MGRERSQKRIRAMGARIMRGGFANISALVALLFSSYSFYETVWKAEDLRLFVPPVIQFSDPANGPFDVFVVPVTIANTGARPGVALSFDLDVTNPRTGAVKRYYAAGFGSWRAASQGQSEPFAPISVPGRTQETRQIIFYPRAEEEIDRHIETEAGEYGFRLTLNAAAIDRGVLSVFEESEGPVSLAFELTIDGLDYRAFNEGGTLGLRRPDYQPVSSE